MKSLSSDCPKHADMQGWTDCPRCQEFILNFQENDRHVQGYLDRIYQLKLQLEREKIATDQLSEVILQLRTQRDERIVPTLEQITKEYADLKLMTESYRSKLAKLCKEISHIGHLRSCSYGLSDGPAGDYCNCNLHLRKQLILEAREALEGK